MNTSPSTEQLIEQLALQPHPEGGYFKEVYRSSLNVHSKNTGASRNALTSIYFLLTEGQVSRFHRVKHDEIWNFYLGSPLRLIDLHEDHATEQVLGLTNIEQANTTLQFQHVIPANHWQAAESLGEYTLVGCAVAPGFDFADFSFMNSEQTTETQTKFSEYSKFL